MFTSGDYAELIARLEAEALAHPRWYRAKVLGLALIGHAGPILACLLSLLTLVAVAVGLYSGADPVQVSVGGITLLVFAWIVFRILRVALPTPAGHAIDYGSSAALFELIDKIRGKLGTPAIDSVLLTADFNAAIVQQPRLGMAGLHRNVLLLGLPLMLTLSNRQFAAVLAHEFGHLSARHGKFAGWVYRLRNTWARLLETHHEDTRGLSKLLARYVHYFNAYSFVLARQHEFEADQASVLVCGEQVTADALVLSQLASRYLAQCFWPAVFARADSEPKPTGDPHSQLQQALHAGLFEQDLAAWLGEALAAQTDEFDTHPSLKDRLEHIGAYPAVPSPADMSAAHRLFGKTLPGWLNTLDQEWRQAVQQRWHTRHRQVQDSRRELAELATEASTTTLTPPRQWRRGQLLEEMGRDAEAIDAYQQVLALQPEFAPASLALGRLKLLAGDNAGLDQLDNAMRLDPRSTPLACRLVYDYLGERDPEGAENYFRLACEYAVAVDRERDNGLPGQRSLRLHDLSAHAKADLRRQLARLDAIRQTWLVRRPVDGFPERWLYLLLVEPGGDAAAARRQCSELTLPGQCFVVILDGRNRSLKQRAQRLIGTKIYPD